MNYFAFDCICIINISQSDIYTYHNKLIEYFDIDLRSAKRSCVILHQGASTVRWDIRGIHKRRREGLTLRITFIFVWISQKGNEGLWFYPLSYMIRYNRKGDV